MLDQNIARKVFVTELIPRLKEGATDLGERAAQICEAQMTGDPGIDSLLRIIAGNLRYYEIRTTADALWYLGDSGQVPEPNTPSGAATIAVRQLTPVD